MKFKEEEKSEVKKEKIKDGEIKYEGRIKIKKLKERFKKF
jgi:hypothetical protein